MKGVVLFGYNFIVQAGDMDFFRQMNDLGLSRANPLICAEHKDKAILATKYDYGLVSFDNKDEFINQYGLIATYTPQDFINEIKRLQNGSL